MGRPVKRDLSKVPLHIKPAVVGAVDMRQVELLAQKDELCCKYLDWVKWSPLYDRIRALAAQPAPRSAVALFTTEDFQVLGAAKKIEKTGTTDTAKNRFFYCNGFTTFEDKDGGRRRPIIEPLINDIIANDKVLAAHCRVTYTAKNIIREAVWQTEGACQFDMAAWFDQLPLDPKIQKFFQLKVPDESTIFRLKVLPMGFRPSCVVAQGIISLLLNGATVTTASCVDNVIFFGDKSTAQENAKRFLQRADVIQAKVKDTTIHYEESYDFLGEHYNHKRKTRCLTEKTRAKAEYCSTLLASRSRFTTRQLLAIFGLLLFCASALDIGVSEYHFAMRFLSQIATTPMDAQHAVPQDALRALSQWATIARTNREVPVWYFQKSEPDIIIYTDASVWGWGALSIKDTKVIPVSVAWSLEDRQLWALESSVAAEPLAVIRALSYFIPLNKNATVVVYTDHQPLVYASTRGWGKAYTYSVLCTFLRTMRNQGVDVQIKFIEGHLNPADPLSRGKPPLLPVTHIAGKAIEERIGGRWIKEVNG